MPACSDRDHRLHRAVQGGELAGGGGDRLRDAVQAQLDLGDDAERALAADEQPRQVVAGGGFAHPPAGADHPPVGQHHRQAQHVLADGAVAHRVGAGGAGGAHAADGAVGARDRPGRTGRCRADAAFSAAPGHARLHPAVHVRLVHLQHRVMPRQVDADAAAHRRDVAFQRGAGAERPPPARGARGRAPAGARLPRWSATNATASGNMRRMAVLAVRVVLAQHGVPHGQPLAQQREPPRSTASPDCVASWDMARDD